MVYDLMDLYPVVKNICPQEICVRKGSLSNCHTKSLSDNALSAMPLDSLNLIQCIRE